MDGKQRNGRTRSPYTNQIADGVDCEDEEVKRLAKVGVVGGPHQTGQKNDD